LWICQNVVLFGLKHLTASRLPCTMSIRSTSASLTQTIGIFLLVKKSSYCGISACLTLASPKSVSFARITSGSDCLLTSLIPFQLRQSYLQNSSTPSSLPAKMLSVLVVAWPNNAVALRLLPLVPPLPMMR
jgi:hypothetical protein